MPFNLIAAVMQAVLYLGCASGWKAAYQSAALSCDWSMSQLCPNMFNLPFMLSTSTQQVGAVV
jgi:hypothetical protein